MKNEIERKFFVREMPDVSDIEPLRYERYFLKNIEGIEERITKVNDRFFHETKTAVSALERSREKNEITEPEFIRLKDDSSEAVMRERYNVSRKPDIAIHIYHGRFEGLVRAEVEFESVDEAKTFTPLPWMGEEMTGLPIARDSMLIGLKDKEFQEYVATRHANKETNS